MRNSFEQRERTDRLSDDFIQYLERWFDRYAGKFSRMDPEQTFGYSLKIEHTARTTALMRDIAEAEGLDVNLASACALLHDLGRFPQLWRYRTFVDALSANHAQLACDVMAEEGVLKALDTSVVRIIRGAILHHNAKAIPDGVDPSVLPYARALRDADKLDILFLHVNGYESNFPLEKIPGHKLEDSGRISQTVLDAVRTGRSLSRSELTTVDDAKLLLAGWLHDLNTRRAFQIFREQRYLDRLFSSLPESEDLSRLRRQLEALIDEGSFDQAS